MLCGKIDKILCGILYSFSFIRIVGTYNTVNNSFHLVSIEAMYTSEPFDIDPVTTLLGD